MTATANLADLAADIEWPDHAASTQAHDAVAVRPELGRLGTLVEWICGAQSAYPPKELIRARLIVFAADHRVASAGVSAYPPGRLASTVADIESGRASLATLAELTAAGVRVVTVELPAGRIDVEDGMSADDTAAAIAIGAGIADDEIDSGADLLIVANIGAGSTTCAAAIVSVLTGTEPVKVTGRGGSGIDDDAWMRKVTAIRDARRRAWPRRDSPQQLLGAIGAPDVAAMTGLLLQAAARRTPVLLDGVVAAAAATLAGAQQVPAVRWWQAAQRTGEPAQALALARLDLTPILDLGMAVGDGSGGLLALTVLRAAIALAAVSPPVVSDIVSQPAEPVG